MYNDEFNNNDMYRFTNREVPHDDYAPAPRQENTYTAPVKKQGFFRRTWVKVTALVLACAVVVLLHLWKRNTMLSITGGTACYMLLVQIVFA